jgi:hypothetical protein
LLFAGTQTKINWIIIIIIILFKYLYFPIAT